MSTRRGFRSEAFEAIHASASALRRIDAIDDATMDAFERDATLRPRLYSPSDIRRLREANGLTAGDFARALEVSETTILRWEAGASRPSRIASKLLSIVEKQGIAALR